MVKWVTLIVLLLSGVALSVIYWNIKELERDPSKIPVSVSQDALVIAHAYRDGVHRYAGYFFLPNSCHEVKSEIWKDDKVQDNFELQITTRDKQLETAFCSQLSTRYYFSVIEEGPRYVNLKLRVNGKEREYKLVEGEWPGTSEQIEMRAK